MQVYATPRIVCCNGNVGYRIHPQRITAINTYNAVEALQSIDSNVVWVLLFFAVAAAATFVYLIESFRLTRSHASFASPLPAVGWFAVHDLHFVLLFELWFDVYDHWWVKAWWVALVFTTIIEFALVAMIIRYGRREIAPWASQRQFAGLIVLGTAAIGIIWLLAKSAMDDPLFLISFPITAFWAVPFSTALMLRRNSQRGQSVRLPVCSVFIIGSFQGALWFVDEFFRSPYFLMFTAMGISWSLVNIWLIQRLPAYQPQTA